MRRVKARSRLIRIAVLNLIGILAGILVAEAALRILGIGDPSFGRVDPVTGWSGYPHATGYWRSEGASFVRYNSAGFHDVERTVEKPAGVHRIAFIGDSFTEALHVPPEANFCSVADREIARCASPGERYEILNFGQSGFGTAQELLLMRDRVLKYSPDLVVLAFFTGNDITDNSRALSNDARKPYFVNESGSLVLDDSFRNSTAYVRTRVAYALVRWSRTFQLVKRWLRSRESREALQSREGRSWNETRLEIYQEPTDATWKDAWNVTESLIVQMRDEARASGAEFAVVTLSNSLQVYPDLEERRQRLEQLGIDDPFRPDKRIARLGRDHGFPVLNLAPEMLAYVQSRRVSLHGFPNAFTDAGHWNEEGHRLAGTLIAHWLCAMKAKAPANPGIADENPSSDESAVRANVTSSSDPGR